MAFFSLIAAGFVSSFNTAAISAVIPSMAADFHKGEFEVGRITWMYMIPYGVSALFCGPLARRFDKKKILLLSIACLAPASLGAGLADNLPFLYLFRIIGGIAAAAIIPISLITIALGENVKSRGQQVGLFFSVTYISSLLGLFLSGFVSWRLLFYIPAALACIVLYLVFRFMNVSSGEKPFRFGLAKVLSDMRVVRLFVYIFCISTIYHAVSQWLGVYFSTERNLEQLQVSMLLTTGALSGVIGENLGGRLSDKLGRNRVIDVGAGLMLFSLIWLILESRVEALFLITFVLGIGWTFNHVGVSTFLTGLPKNFLYESASLNSSVRFLAGGFGAWLGGLISKRGFPLSYTMLSVGLSILILLRPKLVAKVV